MLDEKRFIIIIISLLQSTAGHMPLQLIAISLYLSIKSSLHVATYTTFTETRSPLQNSFTPTVVGSTADMASPLPLQLANTVCFVDDFSSLPEHLVSDSIQKEVEKEIYKAH
jgi:hypothetical protein